MEEKINVLILEDLPSDAELAERELKTVLKNYTVVVTDTEQGFIKALENFKPDLIISDYMLPAFNGLKALQITRKKKEFIPFIILTGSMNEETAVECMKAGADDYVIKEHIKRLGPAILGALDKKKNRQERKQAEESLRDSEETFKGLFNNTTDAIYVQDEDGVFLDVNQGAVNMYGYTREELIGNTPELVSAPGKNDLKMVNACIQKAFNGEPQQFEFWGMRKDGEVFPKIVRVSAGKYFGKKIILAFATDITRRKQVEDNLKESEANVKAIIEGTNNSIWAFDRHYRILYINRVMQQAFLQTFGVLMESGTNILEALPEELRPIWKPRYDRVLANEHFTIEDSISTDKGKIYIQVSFNPIIENGEVIGGSCFGDDITEHKQAEAERIKLSTAVTQSPSVIAITDADGKLEYVNPKFSEITGYSFEEAIGQNPRVLKSGEQSDEMYKELWETVSSGKEWRGEFHNKKKNGDLFWETASVSPIFDDQGKIVNYIKVAEDITERKLVEDNFRYSIDESPLGIRIVNQTGKTIYVNKALLAIYEFSSLDEFLNARAQETYTQKSYQEHKERKRIRQEGGDVSDYEISIRRNNGEIRYIQVWRKEVIWNMEKHFQVINQDITELKRLNIDLILAKEKAEESNRLKTAFLNNMSHEIRTPLNGITGFIGLLQDSEIDDEQKQHYFNIINKSSDRLIATVTDILDISRIEAGEDKVSKTEVLVNKILDEQYNFFYPQAQSKGLELIYKPCVSDNEVRFVTDKYKLEGILSNLIKNAIKFTERGEITFACLLKKEHEIDILEFYVKDTGIGIPSSRIDAIFNRFEQADIEDIKAHQGSGLGLAIAKSYVEMLGGQMTVRSEVGSGSTFTFSLPYIKQFVMESEAKDNKNKEAQTPLSHLSVIIAEDDGTSIMYFDAIFKNEFHKIIYTKTGQETVDKCRENPEADLILMDIKMPDVNGYDATREIRKFNSNVVIIAQTAFGLTGDREKALEAGCDDYISKPIEKEILFEKIRVCLDKKSI